MWCSKSEYIIYKLREMGKISEKDIMQICSQFDMLDDSNCGKLAIADLMENETDWSDANFSIQMENPLEIFFQELPCASTTEIEYRDKT